MKKNILHLIILTLLIIVNVVMIIKTTFAYFSDAAQSTNNTFTAASVFPSQTPTPSPTPALANHIVISEIQIHGTNANEDFVELYNPTNSSVDLSNWKLRVKTSPGTEDSLSTIPSGKSIPAYGFFLWANNKNGYAMTIEADINNSSNISPNNSIALLNNNDIIIDQLGWGNGSNQFFEGTIYPLNPTNIQSLERKAYSSSTTTTMISGSDIDKGNSYDSDNNNTDFVLRTTSQPQNISSPIEIP